MKKNRMKSPCIALFLLFVSACAVQRAQDSETAQQLMLGMTKEQVFACMGIPKRKGKEGGLEVWAYDSGNGRIERTRTVTSFNRRGRPTGNFWDALGESLSFGGDVSERRFCAVHVIFEKSLVKRVNYSGPTGGFLTEDEQCAYAVRNCLMRNSSY